MKAISLCTVSIDPLKPYLELMIKSALEKLTNLHEIIICNIDAKFYRPETIEKIGNVNIRRIDVPIIYEYANIINFNMSEKIKVYASHIMKNFHKYEEETRAEVLNDFGHALGLHECIKISQADYILFCDPDVIFHTDVDNLYFKYMSKYNLDYIGCAHESANKLVYGNFPYLANSLLRKISLPGEDFLEKYLCFSGQMKWIVEDKSDYIKAVPAPGKYLIRGVIPELVDKFEIPPDKIKEMDFDTGCNLYLWSKQQNWQWLSFLSSDCQNYKTSFYRSSFVLKDKIEIKHLIYHQYGRYRKEKDSFQKFQQVYQKSKELEYVT